MEYKYNFKIRIVLLALIILSLTLTGFLLFEAIESFNKTSGIGYFIPALIELVPSAFCLYLFFKVAKMDPNKESKGLGVVELSFLPPILFVSLILCFIFPRSINVDGLSWLYYVEMSLMVALFILFMVTLFILERRIITHKNDGLLPIFSTLLFVTLIHLILFFSYFISYIRIRLFEGIDAQNQYLIETIASTYLSSLVVQLIYSLIILLVVFLVGFVTLAAGLEKRVIGFHGTYKDAIQVGNKYSLPFWIGIVMKFFLFIIAIFSAINLGHSYVSLVCLYGVIILVLLPSFFWQKHIEKLKESNYQKFKEKHKILIFSAVLLGILLICEIFIGRAGAAKQDVSKSAFATYVIFIPYALIKFGHGIYMRLKAKKTGDPIIRNKANIDLLLSIVTINTAIYYIAHFIRGTNEIDEASHVSSLLYVIGIVVAVIEIAFIVYVIIDLLIIGIRGIKDKRLNYFKEHFVEKDISEVREVRE